MNVLVVGGGGREHAVVKALAKSSRVSGIFCAPGNGGIAADAVCEPVPVTDIPAMVAYAKKINAGMVCVTPDDPLCAGMADALIAEGIKAFGPLRLAAQIEGSKVFAKDLMKRYGIPTAGYEVFEDPAVAAAYITSKAPPFVVKADGLALGKGVIICDSREQALLAVDEIMSKRKFGESGSRIVIEEFISGPEVSALAFCDGKTLKLMPSAQDHKRAHDGDKGLNTGGMGAFSPSAVYTKEIEQYCIDKIFKPVITAMRNENREFRGVIYFGLMLTVDGPKLLECNARFGDPETQALLPLLKTDLLDIFEACADGTLDKLDIEWHEKASVCVVLASGGYPGDYVKGYEIDGLDSLKYEGITVYHAGTKLEEGRYHTNGGRVLGITATGIDVAEARKLAYDAVSKISFRDIHYRKDIGIK